MDAGMIGEILGVIFIFWCILTIYKHIIQGIRNKWRNKNGRTTTN